MVVDFVAVGGTHQVTLVPVMLAEEFIALSGYTAGYSASRNIFRTLGTKNSRAVRIVLSPCGDSEN